MSGELLQQQVDYVTDLYDTLCPEWMNVYEWTGNKSLVDHATNALCTIIELCINGVNLSCKMLPCRVQK